MSKDKDGNFVVSRAFATVVLAAFLSGAIAWWWTDQAKRDQIIVLETTVKMIKENDVTRDSRIDQATNWAQGAKGDFRELQGQFRQFSLDYGLQQRNHAGGGNQ